jgi:hypothetical protein
VVSGSSVPIYQTKNSLVTNGENQPTGLTLSNIASEYSRVQVFINGQLQILGDGDATKDCYFWDGFTAVSFNNLSIGNELYWNGITSGFNLDTTDTIQVVYES